ncbi:hypothetical protein ACFX1Z_009110 [Malus domestica]
MVSPPWPEPCHLSKPKSCHPRPTTPKPWPKPCHSKPNALPSRALASHPHASHVEQHPTPVAQLALMAQLTPAEQPAPAAQSAPMAFQAA